MAKKETSNQEVSAALELLITTLSEEKQRIYDAGAAAMKKQDSKTARAVLNFADKLEDFRSNVQDLVEKWNELLLIRESATPAVQEIVTGEGRLFSAKPRKIATGFTRTINHPLAHKTIFRITFEDGTVIAESQASETLLKAIAKIGEERVFGLGLINSGEPLVSETQSLKYPSASKKVGKYYVLTHSNTSSKVAQLRRIMKLLSVNAEIQIYEAPDSKK